MLALHFDGGNDQGYCGPPSQPQRQTAVAAVTEAAVECSYCVAAISVEDKFWWDEAHRVEIAFVKAATAERQSTKFFQGTEDGNCRP